MRVLCERHVPPKYVDALDSAPWATVSTTEETFHPEVDDDTIAEYAAANGWVVLTRDRDFFELATAVRRSPLSRYAARPISRVTR